MSTEAWLIIVNGGVQLLGLIILVVITIRGHHELARIGRAIAGLVIQEEQKTRAEIQAAPRRP